MLIEKLSADDAASRRLNFFKNCTHTTKPTALSAGGSGFAIHAPQDAVQAAAAMAALGSQYAMAALPSVNEQICTLFSVDGSDVWYPATVVRRFQHPLLQDGKLATHMLQYESEATPAPEDLRTIRWVRAGDADAAAAADAGMAAGAAASTYPLVFSESGGGVDTSQMVLARDPNLGVKGPASSPPGFPRRRCSLRAIMGRSSGHLPSARRSIRRHA